MLSDFTHPGELGVIFTTDKGEVMQMVWQSSIETLYLWLERDCELGSLVIDHVSVFQF